MDVAGYCNKHLILVTECNGGTLQMACTTCGVAVDASSLIHNLGECFGRVHCNVFIFP